MISSSPLSLFFPWAKEFCFLPDLYYQGILSLVIRKKANACLASPQRNTLKPLGRREKEENFGSSPIVRPKDIAALEGKSGSKWGWCPACPGTGHSLSMQVMAAHGVAVPLEKAESMGFTGIGGNKEIQPKNKGLPLPLQQGPLPSSHFFHAAGTDHPDSKQPGKWTQLLGVEVAILPLGWSKFLQIDFPRICPVSS